MVLKKSRITRDPLETPPFMANTILNFHFDYRHPSLRNIAIISCLDQINVPRMHKTKLIEVAKIMGWKKESNKNVDQSAIKSFLLRSQLILCTFMRGSMSWTWTSVLDKYFYYVIRAMKKSKTSPKKYANQTGKMQSRKMIKYDNCFPFSMIT